MAIIMSSNIADKELRERLEFHRIVRKSDATFYGYQNPIKLSLAILRHALNLAQEWKIIDRVPKFRMLSGEKPREFVLSHEQERLYLENTPQSLRNVALLILDTGLRLGETLGLTKADILLRPTRGAEFGILQVREGKSKNARRVLSLTERVQSMLKSRMESNDSIWVFPDRGGDRPYRISSLDHQHKRVRRRL